LNGSPGPQSVRFEQRSTIVPQVAPVTLGGEGNVLATEARPQHAVESRLVELVFDAEIEVGHRSLPIRRHGETRGSVVPRVATFLVFHRSLRLIGDSL
jgi:hypothetical protein